ncbi:TIGR03013 family XrtA/PEP-CTERM system glycosyltransferase [Photobacterium nomapromontoriensis]|uniref:TIGR03013 family XrtA/PEP-CTERM system glycosyltransferase n=1 Tax=Photobacterium nomapromontoriensis TaxID=2910237 RepID=UPI003D0D7215
MIIKKSGFHDLNISNAILIFLDFITLSFVFYFSIKNNELGQEVVQISVESLIVTVHFLLFTLPIQLAILAVGLYNEKIRENFNGIIIRLVVAILLAYLFMVTLSLISPHYYLSSHTHELIYISALSALVFSRFIAINCHYERLGKRRVLLIGYGQRAQLIHSTMRRKTDRVNFDIIGYVKINGDKTYDDNYIKPIELTMPLEKFIIDNNINEVVVALDERRNNLPYNSLFHCKLHDIQVLDIIDFVERETGQIAINHIHPSFVLFNSKSDVNQLFEIFNWIFNTFVTLLVISITWPLIFLTIILIKIEDGIFSPIFYTQKRVGIKGKVFTIYKFRSMIEDAELNGEMMSSKSDNRITNVGYFIRKYRIDELPQLFNILIGDMCFVGPRPERPQFSKQFEHDIPFYTHRYLVKPGLTGWAQLKYPYGDNINDAKEKLKFDLYYIKHRSFILDLLILIRTSEIVIFGKGR